MSIGSANKNNSTLKDTLELMQQLMTDHFVERLQSGEITPSELNTVRQLLKDNHIVVSPERSEGLGTLGTLLPDFGSGGGDGVEEEAEAEEDDHQGIHFN